MDKQEKLYRLNKAMDNLHGYTTLTNEEKLERVIQEILKILEGIIEDQNETEGK